ALLIFGWLVYHKKKEINQTIAQQQGSLVLSNFATASSPAIETDDLATLHNLMQRTAAFDQVRRLAVTDNQGRVLAMIDHPAGLSPIFNDRIRDLTLPNPTEFHLQKMGNNLILWEPVADQGWVYMIFDDSSQSNIYLTTLRSQIWIAILLATLTSLYFLILLARPLRQLQKLVAFAQSLDVYQGEAQIHIDASTQEIRDLNLALNHSATRLFQQSQRILRSEAQHRQVIQAIREVIFQTDIQGHWTFLNPAWEVITGYALDKSLGQSFMEHVLEEDIPHITNMLAPLRSLQTESLRCELRFTAADHRVCWLDVWMAVQRNEAGWVIGATGTLNDITARKAAEAELINARDEAQAATRAKSEFLATMSHEIRTPMNGVLGMAQLLIETPMSNEQKDYVRTIYQSGLGLLTIINDILDFSKIEAGKLTIEPIAFDLLVVLEEVCELMTPQVQQKKIELMLRYDPHCPRYLIGDTGRIRQIALNYLSNAVKFTEHGHVLVDISALNVSPEKVRLRLSVTDTGIGISPDKAPSLFQRFSQADASTTRRFGGTGLGLAICKALTEMMGGQVGVNSEFGQGSTFWAELLLSRQQNTQDILAHDLADMRILIVDHSILQRKIIAEALSVRGALVQEAADARKALSTLNAARQRGIPFQNTLIDYALPDINGLTLGRFIRSDRGLQSTSVLLMTPPNQRTDQGRLREAGFDAVFSKPLRIDSLLLALQRSQTPLTELVTSPPAPLLIRQRPLVGQGRRALLAEDNPVNQKVATKMLEKFGMSVDVARNGLDAVKLYLQVRYDIIFMDCQMPDMDGFATTREIRRLQQLAPSARAIPIVALTANIQEGERERCLACGMNDFLGKPLKLQDLSDVLQRNFGQHNPTSSIESVS
ncbi:MAG: response regulator, partial [Pseudomonadales bacterium]|nr:response regulator [Pseudomonadales bacterium]